MPRRYGPLWMSDWNDLRRGYGSGEKAHGLHPAKNATPGVTALCGQVLTRFSPERWDYGAPDACGLCRRRRLDRLEKAGLEATRRSAQGAMRIHYEFDDDLHRRATSGGAALPGQTLKEFVEEALEQLVDQAEAERTKRR